MIEVRSIGKRYSKKEDAALADVSAVFGNRGLVAICGPAACGKTTLLSILGGIEKPDSGEVLIDGKPVSRFGEGDWNKHRNGRVALVFQEPVLVGYRTVLENVELALKIQGVGTNACRDRATEALKLMGVESCASKKPSELSSTHQRLVGVARALAKEPEILLVDEPTSGLDKDSAETVLSALQHAAEGRLVILATSDEGLATRYASRIIRLENGTITSDDGAPTAVVDAAGTSADAASADGGTAPMAAVAAGAGVVAAQVGRRAGMRRSMPFFSAVGYSMRNISAKKGRASLTAIASAISMIAITAIVALNGGANNLISSYEEGSIATDPILIGKSALDLSALLGSDNLKNIISQSTAEEQRIATPGSAKVNSEGKSLDTVSSFFKEVNANTRDNDLAGFKQFIDSNTDGILDNVDTVKYDYGMTPLIFNGDMSRGVERLNPSLLTILLKRRANTTTSALNEFGRFNEMVGSQRILDEQMNVVRGTWPTNYDECVVVLDGNGGISDLTLYQMGLYDHEAVNNALSAAMNGQEAQLPESPAEVSYDQLMNASFVVLPRVSLYQKNAARGTWADKSFDNDYVAQKIGQDGIRLKVVGIVQPKPGVPSPLMDEGVGYMPELTQRLIDISSQSEITQQQMAHPDIDVFTNRSFEDLKANPLGNLDAENIVTINQAALGRLIGIFDVPEGEEQPQTKQGDTELMGVDLSEIDWSQFELDARDVLDAVNEQRIYDALALAMLLDPGESGLELTPEQQAEVNTLTGNMVADFTAYAIDEGATVEDLHDPKVVAKYWKAYQETEKGETQMTALDLLVGKSYGDIVRQQLEVYLTTVYAEVLIDEIAADVIEQALDDIATEVEKELERVLPVIAEELAKQIGEAVITTLDRVLVEVGQGVTEIATRVSNEVSNLIQVNLNEEDLVAFVNNVTDGANIGYDNNMAKLGYTDTSKPLSISIYPKNLAAKHKVADIIAAYNERMDKAGAHDRTIIYSDTSGDMSKALSAVTDVISLVLIVLIALSLIVGVIMVVIVACSGVAERRREMGLLRSLGASRGNLMTMFNVETLVEGLIAGVIAVGVVLLISSIVNNMTAASLGGVEIMVLSPHVVVGLIALSGVLPLVAGLIPSFVMSLQRPVQSLRG